MDKNKKIMIGAAVAAILAAAVLFFVMEGSGKDEQAFRDAFKQFSADLGAGNKADVGNLISRKFNDAGMDYNVAVEEFGIKRPGYMTEITGIKIKDALAEVNYTRKQVVNKKMETNQVAGETWVKDDDGKWRLVKLSASDRTQLPKLRQARKEAEDKLAADLRAAEEAESNARKASYSYANKRDPFESLIVETAPGEAATVADASHMCDPGRPRQFLEGFDLFSFKLVGMVSANNAYYALVEAPNGNGYTLKAGMYIGRRCGKITKITAGRIIVAEKFPTPRGEFSVKEMELKLKEEE